ncbi:MAG TPA: hypothetical protein VHZ55_08105 [Bryobacteraceae bacterium]|jgi:hypothetical protein|nr:hypothetical protein [Bryobacteraceae bacterium]
MRQLMEGRALVKAKRRTVPSGKPITAAISGVVNSWIDDKAKGLRSFSGSVSINQWIVRLRSISIAVRSGLLSSEAISTSSAASPERLVFALLVASRQVTRAK